MAEAIGSAAGGHPDLNLSTEERRVYGELLKEADPDGFGAVSGDVAVKFFERTKLPPDVLGQIWQIADTENRGFLTPSGFGVVLRLIGHAQAGRFPAASLAPQSAPLPRFDPISRPPPAAAAPLAAQTSGTPSSPSASGPGPIRVPALTPDKANEYSALFEKSGAQNGSLSGLEAKRLFERARLPNEVLGRIWNLADTQGRGSLDLTEFVIAMHLLASYKSGQMRSLPNALPPGLYDAAARRPPPRMAAASPRPGSATGIAPGITPQFSGYGGRPQSPVIRQQAGTPLSAQSTGDGWIITPADKQRFDQVFASVDRQGAGYINGEQAVTFFGNARLPEETLAQIWDLADIDSDGQLNKDEFAVAMYLIRQQRGTKDGRGILPSSLPPALVPPSMRRQSLQPSQPTAPAFENAPVTQPRSAADDLFGLDVLSPATQPPQPLPPTQSPPAQVPQSTGGTDAGPFGSPKSPTFPPSTTVPGANSMFKPFQPSSSFGQGMLSQSTGPPGPVQSRAAPAPVASEDLLGDADATVSSKLTNETAELGNLSNQVGSLSKEMTDLQGKRAQAEQELSQNAQQKHAFETRLSQLRAAFDKEVQEFKTLQEQLTASRNDNKRLQQDIAMIEGSQADTKKQHEQLRSAYEADQRENVNLKEKIRQINMETDQLKPQIEKLKSDSRQQKGLVAINRKQLSTNEDERDRLQNELKAAQKEVEDAIKEAEETSRRVEASKKELEEIRAVPKPTVPVHVPTQPPVHETAHASEYPTTTENRSLSQASLPLASPTPSTTSNPFMKREGSTIFSPPIGSPEPTHDHSAFDSIFGPSFGAAAGAAPLTSFRSETPTNQTIHDQSLPRIETATPTSGAAPDVIEPPAPPSGKQITSESLPLRTNLERTESMTSSVKVVPPASRLSPVDTPRAMTPSADTPDTDKLSSDSFAAAAPDEEQKSVRQSLPRMDTNEKTAGIPGAFPAHTPRSVTPAQNVNPTTVAVGAAAATVAAGAGLAAAAATAPEGEKENQNQTRDEPLPVESNTSKTNNFDEFFGGPAHQRTPSEQVKDFDDAFASLQNGPAATNGPAETNGPAGTNKEFPDIQELDDDDDDSSAYSENSRMGFDDDFNAKPIAPAPEINAPSDPAAGSKAAGKQPDVAPALPGHLQPRPPLETASSAASSLPGIEQQVSPPTYKESVPNDNPSHFPMEYKGLLPEREDPTSPQLPTTGGLADTGPNSSGIPPAYGPEVAKTQGEALNQAAASAMAKPTNFDFDSVFANLGPAPTTSTSAAKPNAFDFDSAFATMGAAQVDEDDSDEADATLGSQRNQPLEFDPSFESPGQSRAPTVASTTQSPMTTHDQVTSATTNGTSADPKTSSSSFLGFNDSVITSASVQTGGNTAPTVSHDWDTLFAPLSSPPAVDSNAPAAGTETMKSETEISPNVNARTSAVEISGTSTPIPPATSTFTPLPSSNLKIERPQPGRALSTGTEHDDPILKRLTAMGWSRGDSLAALEKFDYNIDKAADYLTFRS